MESREVFVSNRKTSGLENIPRIRGLLEKTHRRSQIVVHIVTRTFRYSRKYAVKNKRSEQWQQSAAENPYLTFAQKQIFRGFTYSWS